MTRTRPASWSRTSKVPSGALASGPPDSRRANRAGPPSPVEPLNEGPLWIIRTAPSELTPIRKFVFESRPLMRSSPSAPSASQTGNLSRTAVAGRPLLGVKGPPPAKVVMIPLVPMRRTREPPDPKKLPISATKIVPSRVTATSEGTLRLAAAAGPWSPEEASTPLPAMVLMIPSGVTRRIR